MKQALLVGVLRFPKISTKTLGRVKKLFLSAALKCGGDSKASRSKLLRIFILAIGSPR